MPINNSPESIKEVVGGVSNGSELFVIDQHGVKWKALKELMERVKLGIEALAFSRVLKEVGASQELVNDYPETPNLFNYLQAEKNSWLQEQLQEGADEETIRKELRDLFFRFALEGAENVEVIQNEIEKTDYSAYQWEKA